MKNKINVLGTDYKIIYNVNEDDDPYIVDCDGYIDYTTKEIYIKDMSQHGWSDTKYHENTVTRHELIHAFLYESGLNVNSDWARNEELIDWIALQIPKINKSFEELNINNN